LSLGSAGPPLPGLTWLAAAPEPIGYAHALYANLRELDAAGAQIIIVERPPEQAQWLAVLDRLTRAAAGSAAAEAT
jgi:L-threonylcarbamoyladenylate synthase